MVTLFISSSHHPLDYDLVFYILSLVGYGGTDQFQRSHLAFPTVGALYDTEQGLGWALFQLPIISIQVLRFRPGEMTTGWPHHLTRTPFITWSS